MKITATEQRRLDLFEAGQSIEDIAAAEGATIQSIKTSIWRAKAKRDGSYKAPAASTGGSKKAKGFTFKAEDMEKVEFIKKSYIEDYGIELNDEELISRALRNLFEEFQTNERLKAERKEKQRQAKAEQERQERERREKERQERQRKARTRRTGKMKLKYFTGFEETTKDIKKTYKTWSKKLHPDMPTGDHAAFIKLTEEYEYMMAR